MSDQKRRPAREELAEGGWQGDRDPGSPTMFFQQQTQPVPTPPPAPARPSPDTPKDAAAPADL